MFQNAMIDIVRSLCREDERITATLMYGSFAKGEGDEFSDIEFYIFLHPDHLPIFNPGAWIRQVAPTELILTNEFGTTVAIFANLIRGEFHFELDTRIDTVSTWGRFGESPRPSAMILKDLSGALADAMNRWQISITRPASPEELDRLVRHFFNMLLFGINVLKRGERARALDILSWLHRYLLWLARADTGSTQHWATPSRFAERDLPHEVLNRLHACAATLAPGSLESAYIAAWHWFNELMTSLSRKQNLILPATLIASIDSRISSWFNTQ